jgi:ankyrin repeat protein
VKAFLDSGADIRITDNLRWTLVKAASHNGHVKVIKLLLNEDADITIPNNNGWTRVNATSILVTDNDGAMPICPA